MNQVEKMIIEKADHINKLEKNCPLMNRQELKTDFI